MPRFSPRIVEAKATSYSVANGDWGKILTTRGASGTITFTLPAVASTPTGATIRFFNVAGQTMTVAGTAGELVTFNDAAANSVSFSTASELIGGAIEAVCDGTSWLIFIMAEETQTVTVAT